MIILNHQKESLTRSVIQAIAGRCGMTCSYTDFDYGIDVKVNDVVMRTDRGKNRYIESGFDIAIQAKSTVDVIVEDGAIAYDLEIKNYNDLREVNVGTPRILVRLVLPRDETEWLDLTEERIVLQRCAYWHSLKGNPERENDATIRVRIPRENLFTVEALNQLMTRRKEGLEL